jgi:hypothetical protein
VQAYWQENEYYFVGFGSLVPSKGMSVKCGFAETGS